MTDYSESDRPGDYDPTCGACVSGLNPSHSHTPQPASMAGEQPAGTSPSTPYRVPPADSRTAADQVSDLAEFAVHSGLYAAATWLYEQLSKGRVK